jgi:hypothetical protein
MQKIRLVVRRGIWLYDGIVPCEVLIVRRNYFDGPPLPPEEAQLCPPVQTDDEGFHYYAEVFMQGEYRGFASKFHATADEAVAEASKLLQPPVTWIG